MSTLQAISCFSQRAVRKYLKEIMRLPKDREAQRTILRSKWLPLTDAELESYENNDQRMQPKGTYWRYDFSRKPTHPFNMESRRNLVEAFILKAKSTNYRESLPEHDLTEEVIEGVFDGIITYLRKLYTQGGVPRSPEQIVEEIRKEAMRARRETVR